MNPDFHHRMKPLCLRWIYLVVIAFFIATDSTLGDTIRLMEVSSFEDLSLQYWEATTEQVKSWPRWDPTKDPPLAVRVAVDKAFQSLPSGQNKSAWQLEHVSLQQPMKVETRPPSDPVFFYFVTLAKKGNGSASWDCLVALDGTVIKSKKEKLPVEPAPEGVNRVIRK